MSLVVSLRLGCAWLVVALVVALTPSARAQDRVIRTFSVGVAATEVGHIATGEGIDYDGPQAIFAGRNGEVHLLDQVNERLLTFDARQANGPVRTLALPPGLGATDLVMVDGGVVVWAGRPVALEVRGRVLAVARRSEVSANPVLRSMFGQAASTATGADIQSASVTKGAMQRPAPTVTKLTATHGVGPVTTAATPNAARSVMDIIVTSRTTSQQLARLRLLTRDRLGSVELLDIDRFGRFYVLAEVVPATGGAGSQVFIARFTNTWAYDGIFAVPVTPDATLARRFVAVSPEGSVYFLRSRKGATDVLQIALRTPGEASRPSVPATVSPTGPVVPLTPPASEPPAAPSLPPPPVPPMVLSAPPPPPPAVSETLAAERVRIVQTALAYEAFRWSVTSTAYGRDPDFVCAGNTRYRRPGYLWGQLGRSVYGVPYCWGCSGSVAQIAAKLNRGAAAGNVCTQNPPNIDIAGVDCSSFISAAWGVAGHYTTLSLPSISSVVQDPWSRLRAARPVELAQVQGAAAARRPSSAAGPDHPWARSWLAGPRRSATA